MKNFAYFRPTTIEEAVGLLEPTFGRAELLGGGTDLLDLQKEYVAQPEKVVSLAEVKSLRGIRTTRSLPPQFNIGAATTLAEIADDPAVKQHLPALATAAGQVGGPQIRNMGTLGGNLCQRNRCWYFRDEPSPCLLRKGDSCSALAGENQYHAIFTQGHPCVMVNPSTLAPALIVLRAEAAVTGPKGSRMLPLERFFQAPSAANQREHVLEANEVVTGVMVPALDLKNASYEVRHKQSYDWPLVQAAAAFKLVGNTVREVRVCLGHVAPTPLLLAKVAQELEGKELTDDLLAKVGSLACEDAKPLSQNGYKVQLVKVAVKRALLLAAGRPADWEVSP